MMVKLLDEFDRLQKLVEVLEMYDVDVKINKMMLELGFLFEDGDCLVVFFSGGWQMWMLFGKIFLQDFDLLLLDEFINYFDLDIIEWLEGYLKKIDVFMVVVFYDRVFLD